MKPKTNYLIRCNRMHARIPLATCIARQTSGVKIQQVGIYKPLECKECDQGKRRLRRNKK